MASRALVARVLAPVLLAGAALTAIAALVMYSSGDESVVGTLLLYSPRHFVPLGWLAAAIVAAFVSLRWALFALACSAISLFVVGGFVLPFRKLLSGESVGVPLTVVTYNADYSPTFSGRLGAAVPRWSADVILLQGCGEALARELRLSTASEYTVGLHGEFCLATTLPVLGLTIVTLPEAQSGDEKPFALGLRLALGQDTLAVWSVHLISPRLELSSALQMDFSRLGRTSAIREAQLRTLMRQIGSSNGPVVLAGDLNMTVANSVYRRHLAPFRNAFGLVGTGFGFTMKAGFHQVRIDHVLTGDRVVPLTVSVESGWPTEHQPLVARLLFR